MDEQALIQQFHILWGNFPMRARLIRKDRTVLAVNKIGLAEGMVPGVRCIDTPPKEAHVGCLANAALKEGCGKYGLTPNGARLRFWVPVEGSDEIFVHFSIPTQAAIKNPRA